MPSKKLIATIALGSLMTNPVYADEIGGLYIMNDGRLATILYLAPTGRYYLGAGMGVVNFMVNFSSTGTWRSEKGEICIEPSIAPYHVFAATVDHDKSDLPPNAVEVFVEQLEGVGNKATTFFSVGAEFPGRHADNVQWPDDDSNMSYQFVIKPDDAQGYLRVTYEGFDYVYGFPLKQKYNAYRVINSEQFGFDSVTSKLFNNLAILEPPKEEISSLDMIPSCGPLNKKYKRFPPEVSKAQMEEYMKNMVKNIDPQQRIEDGVTYTRIPLQLLKTIPVPQQESEE